MFGYNTNIIPFITSYVISQHICYATIHMLFLFQRYMSLNNTYVTVQNIYHALSYDICHVPTHILRYITYVMLFITTYVLM